MAKKAASAAARPTAPTTRKGRAAAASKAVTKNPPATRQAAPPAAPGVATRLKFRLFNFLGEERAHYLVEPFHRERPPEDVPEKSLAHDIVIIDRSGSMYRDIDPLKTTLVKLLTLDEYNRFELLVTLISYSSRGDLQVHFQRRPIQEVMKRNSRELKEIEKIHVTGLTCISQALRLAASLVKDDELTAITLHSDGYANDPSSTAEAREMDRICGELQGKDVFLNTIAYSNSSDFRLLAKVANSVSGVCLKAGNIKAVYDALNQTTQLLGGSVAPPIEEPLESGFDYQVFLSHKGGKLLGNSGPLKIVGVKADDDAVVYKYRKLTADQFAKLKDVPEVQTHEAVLAFARANLAQGNLNTAKYALASTYDATLTDLHAKALTNLEIAALAQDLEAVLFQPGILQEHEVLDHVRVNKRISLLALARLLGEHRDDFTVNLKALRANYKRRGLRRVQGTRDDSGKLVEPTLKIEYTDPSEYVPVSSFDINHNTANLNMLIARPVRLVPARGGKPIAEVAGIKLDKLSTFNNYTLVSDGELNVPALQIRISKKKLYDQLTAEDGVLEHNGKMPASFDPKAEYTLRLDRLPLVPPFSGRVNLDGVFNDLAEVKVLSSILSAYLKEESADLTPEQVEELKKHYLSKNLYLNFPTTTEYTDLRAALNEGSVDIRVSYKVDIGSRDILNLGKLMSGNKFLDRLYEVSVNGTALEKPTFDQTLDGTVTYRHKQLSSRTRITAVDMFMRRIFDDFLGLAKNGSVAAILARAGDTKLAKLIESRNAGKAPAKAALVEAMAAAKKSLDAYAEKLFEERVSPLVFYVGSTGLLPDEVEAKATSAEALTQKYPNLAFSKDEQEGTYFEIGETILGIYAKNEYYSTGEPVKAE
jgi:Mg-chelatase subunit ChlD